jgi:hypothetical protein
MASLVLIPRICAPSRPFSSPPLASNGRQDQPMMLAEIIEHELQRQRVAVVFQLLCECVFELPTMTAAPITSAGRFSPFGPRMSLPPDNNFRFFDDLYAVPSTGKSDDGRLLFFDPKNARRIFYIHINRLLVHIGAFDPVHIGLLLCAKHTRELGRRDRRSRANKFRLTHYPSARSTPVPANVS